jgi:hypothetical protein
MSLGLCKYLYLSQSYSIMSAIILVPSPKFVICSKFFSIFKKAVLVIKKKNIGIFPQQQQKGSLGQIRISINHL